MGNIESAETGKKLIEVLSRAYDVPFTTKSSFCRQHTDTVALAASQGYITVMLPDGTHTREWRLTISGLLYLTKGTA